MNGTSTGHGNAPTARYRAVDLIAAKRDGEALDEPALRWLIDCYLAGLRHVDGEPDVSEAQMAALLMAGLCRGFTDAEATALTQVMVDSGEVLDPIGLRAPVVDKHSTGGVADGTTLLVGPLVAAAGATLVKLSGRGLGHTGGTLDKLESIPGLQVDLAPDEVMRIAGEVGCVVAAQSPTLVPADAALYALRDVTATVPDPALIASSVMSKKLAGGAPTIVLDVKAGGGAFMPTVATATELAERCVAIGGRAGRTTRALVTDMDQPLGTGVGNALEVAECVRLLSAPPDGDLAAVALQLASHLVACGRAGGPADAAGVDEAHGELARRWADGEALERLRTMVAAQGGDPKVCDDPAAVLPAAPVRRAVPAAAAGAVAAVPARPVGEAAARLGAGRARKGDAVDPAVGIELHVAVGDEVAQGQSLATVHARTDADAEEAAATLAELVEVRSSPVQPPTVVHAVIG